MDFPHSNVNIEFIKNEVNTNLCVACLSADRALSMISDKADLFQMLLGHHNNLLNPESLCICWECMAFLRKMRKFQYQIQYANLVLKQLLYQQDLGPKSLSKLSIKKLENVDIIESLKNELPNEVYKIYPEVNVIDLPIANEDLQAMATNKCPQLTLSTLHNLNPLLPHLKEEYYAFDENSFPDHYSDQSEPGLVIDEPERKITPKIKNEQKANKSKEKTVMSKRNGTEKESSEKPKTGSYHLKFNRTAKRTRNPDVDLKNYKSCFVKVRLSESDIENLGKFVEKTKRAYLHCAPCKKEFEFPIDIRRHKTFCHILKEKAHGPFHCLECQEICHDSQALRDHWTNHNVTYRCKICSAPQIWRSGMKAHAERHAYFWTCVACKHFKVVYRLYADFSYHYRTIHKRCVCDYCGLKSKTKTALAHHIRLKHLPPICQICNKEFKNNHSLRRHNSQTHPEVLDKFVKPELTYCVECNKQFPSEAKYKLHLSTTVAHNPSVASKKVIVPCPECGKQFARKAYMKNHFKLFHQKQTKHYCELCDKYLVSAWSMKKHIQGVHQKIRVPKTKICDTCGRAFGTNAVLEKHRRTHTGERPYKCARCPAAFAQSSALQSHTRTQHRALT